MLIICIYIYITCKLFFGAILWSYSLELFTISLEVVATILEMANLEDVANPQLKIKGVSLGIPNRTLQKMVALDPQGIYIYKSFLKNPWSFGVSLLSPSFVGVGNLGERTFRCWEVQAKTRKRISFHQRP